MKEAMHTALACSRSTARTLLVAICLRLMLGFRSGTDREMVMGLPLGRRDGPQASALDET
ncbi:hypothetical protein BIY45_09415 [Stenotrophomonas sp. BIIR7]|nr:hypothetical protein BIY45_09415 [Stenotrophomonas sp. BIIR7]